MNIKSLPGYGIDFGDKEARIALAVKAAGISSSSSQPELVYTPQTVFHNVVTGNLITVADKKLMSLHLWNELSVQPHYVGILPATPQTQFITSFYNPGNAGFTMIIDYNYFKTLTIIGYRIVRSSSPLGFNQLPTLLSNPSGIRVTS